MQSDANQAKRIGYPIIQRLTRCVAAAPTANNVLGEAINPACHLRHTRPATTTVFL
jgi:hypothetical protein